MDKEFFKANRARLSERLEDNSIMILFAGKAPKKSGDEFYSYTPNRNFFYATGIGEEKVILVISKIKEKVEEILYIQKPDPIMEKWVGKTISSIEAIDISGVKNIEYIEEFEDKIHKLLGSSYIENIYLDLQRTSWAEEVTEPQIYAKTVMEKYPYIRIKNVYPIFVELRMIKSEAEVKQIREAIKITDIGIRSLLSNAKPGMKEYELEAYFNFELKKTGVKDFAFQTICASGGNATVLHYVANDAVAKEGDLVLIDLGAKHNNYSADITRTFPISGKFNERQKQIYNIVLKAQLETMKVIKPGVPFSEINKTTRKVFTEELKKIGLIKEESELSNYYYHGVSHYLGLDTHDVGDREITLKEGMVLTVEPGLYIAEENIGIRIEDDVLVTKDGCENLSVQIIKTVEEIEAFMLSK